MATTPDVSPGGGDTGPIVEDTPQFDITDWDQVVKVVTDRVEDLTSSLLDQVPLLVLALIVLVVGLLLAGIAQRLITRATRTSRLDAAVSRLIQTLSRVLLVTLVILLALTVAGVNVGSALAALGIVGLAIAFAVQSILENFVAGVLILVRRPFRPGDQVQLGEYEGTVDDVNLRVTSVIDYDGEKVLVPNSTVFANPIVNTTERGRRRTTVMVGVDYRDDHDEAREVLRAAVSEVEGVLSTPPPLVLLSELGDSSVNFEVLYWTRPEQMQVITVRDRVLAAAKRGIEEAGMTIPWPIRTLVVDGDSAVVRHRANDPA